MSLPQQRRDLIVGLLRRVRAHRRNNDLLNIGNTHDELHHRRIRNHNDIVLIGTVSTLAFGAQDADHAEGNFLNPNDRANGVIVAEKVVGHGLTYQSDFGCAFDVRLTDEASLLNLPLPNLLKLRRNSLNRSGPVLASGDHLLDLAHHRTGTRYNGNLIHDGFGITGNKGLPAA